MSAARRNELYGGWQEAVKLTRGWTTKVDKYHVEEPQAVEEELVNA